MTANLEDLSKTHKGTTKIRAEKDRLLQKIGDAKAADNGTKLIKCQKAAYHSPVVRFEAYKAAVRRHSTVPLSAAEFLRMADSLLNGAASMDWERDWVYPRPVFDRTKPDGSVRVISTTGSLEDTAREVLIRWLLEAEWQGRLDPRSYGVKGGGVQQALKAVADYIFGHPMFFVRLDIKACFDTVNHDFLFARLKRELTTFSFDRLKPFLLAEFTDGPTIWDTETGIAQGSSLSAMALEIILKDMGEYVTKGFGEDELFFARYVDDLLLMSPDAEILQVAKDRLDHYLTGTSLQLNEAKTKTGTTITWNWKKALEIRAIGTSGITYIEPVEEEKAGLTFLGWQVSQYLSPDQMGYETWLQMLITKGRLMEKRQEEEIRGKRREFERSIKQQVTALRTRVAGKAWVTSCLHYNATIPLEPLEPDIGGGYKARFAY